MYKQRKSVEDTRKRNKNRVLKQVASVSSPYFDEIIKKKKIYKRSIEVKRTVFFFNRSGSFKRKSLRGRCRPILFGCTSVSECQIRRRPYEVYLINYCYTRGQYTRPENYETIIENTNISCPLVFTFLNTSLDTSFKNLRVGQKKKKKKIMRINSPVRIIFYINKITQTK